MKLFFAMIGLLSLAVPVQAQHCRVSCNQVVAVHKVAAVQAVAVVPAPVVLYQSAGYARFDAELEAKITAAFEQGVKAGAREALRQFYADFQAEQAAAETAPQPNGVLDLKTGEFTPGPEWDGPAPAAPPAVNGGDEIGKFIAANCLKCHNGPTGKGGVDLTKLDALTLWRSADAVRAGRMPKGGGKPNPEMAELFSEAARHYPYE